MTLNARVATSPAARFGDPLRQPDSLLGQLYYLLPVDGPGTEPKRGAQSSHLRGGDQILRSSQEHLFARWLSWPHRMQLDDVKLFLSGLGEGAQSWLTPSAYRVLIPPSASELQERLFVCNMEAVIAVVCAPRDWRLTAIFEWAQEQRGNARLTLKTIASRLETSPAYLGSLFQRGTGMPFHTWLRKLRVGQAAELLRNPSRAVTGVAADLGYSAPSNFIREFRRVLGVTPGAFRDLMGVELSVRPGE